MHDPLLPPLKRSAVRRTLPGVAGALLVLVGIALAFVNSMFQGGWTGFLAFPLPFLVLGALVWLGVFISRRPR